MAIFASNGSGCIKSCSSKVAYQLWQSWQQCVVVGWLLLALHAAAGCATAGSDCCPSCKGLWLVLSVYVCVVLQPAGEHMLPSCLYVVGDVCQLGFLGLYYAVWGVVLCRWCGVQ